MQILKESAGLLIHLNLERVRYVRLQLRVDVLSPVPILMMSISRVEVQVHLSPLLSQLRPYFINFGVASHRPAVESKLSNCVER